MLQLFPWKPRQVDIQKHWSGILELLHREANMFPLHDMARKHYENHDDPLEAIKTANPGWNRWIILAMVKSSCESSNEIIKDMQLNDVNYDNGDESLGFENILERFPEFPQLFLELIEEKKQRIIENEDNLN